MTKKTDLPRADRPKKTAQNGDVEILKAQLARALADYQNLQKRVEKQEAEFYEKMLVKLTNKFLPFFDMLSSAQKYTQDSGLAIALGEFENILKEEGVVKIKADKGQVFDEKQHEVIETKGEEPKGIIFEAVTDGWKLMSGSVIRYAKVVIE